MDKHTDPRPEGSSRPADGQTWTSFMNETGAWGLSTMISLYDCDPERIRDETMIRRFVVALCDHIDMRRFGPCTVVNFGEDERVAGYSMTQLIETSLISAHFANASNAVYLDVFSCKAYEPDSVATFAKDWFKAGSVTVDANLRK